MKIIDPCYLRQARIAKDLKDLRDQSVFAFFMMNALFVLIVFLLQLNKDLLHVKWPFGIKTNITYDDHSQEVKTAPSTSRCPASYVTSPFPEPKQTKKNNREEVQQNISNAEKPIAKVKHGYLLLHDFNSIKVPFQSKKECQFYKIESQNEGKVKTKLQRFVTTRHELKHSNCFAAKARNSDLMCVLCRLLKKLSRENGIMLKGLERSWRGSSQPPSPSKGADGSTIDRGRSVFFFISLLICAFSFFFSLSFLVHDRLALPLT